MSDSSRHPDRIPRPWALAAVLAAGLAAVSSAGCGPGDDEASQGWAGTIDTLPDGVVHVSNPAQGLWAEGEEWRLAEDLRIGAVDGEGPDVFGEIRGLAVDGEGRIHVLDGHAHEIRTFDGDGEHLHTLGGQGEGPGELGEPGGLAGAPDGTLWVMDGGNARFSVFDAEGDFVTSHRREVAAIPLSWRGGFTDDGVLVDPTALLEGDMGIVRLDPDSEEADTLNLSPFQPEREAVEDDARPGIRWPIPYQPEHTWAVDPDGHLWWGVNDRFQFVQGSLDGDTLRVVELQRDPPQVTSQDREEVLEALREQAPDGDVPLDESDLPDEKPAYSEILPDDRGHLWVTPFHLPTSPADRFGVDRFHVFDPESRYLGELRTGTALAPHPVAFHDGHLYGVTADELGVEYVVRLRVEGP